MTEAVKPVPDGAGDAALIAAVRRGDTSAYGVLYERHLAAAKRAAACLLTTAAEREDLVAEAFTRVLQTLRAGRGPHEEFRPYLLVTMRHIAINAARRNPATALFADVPDNYLRPVGDDPVVARLHGKDAANAFAVLPERWRMVLWHTEVEGETPAEIAPLLGMTPNGVAALAYRAREGLRQAYLRQHLPNVDHPECRATRAKLAGWVRRSISAAQRRKISAHLDRCPRCRQVAAGLAEVNGELRAVLAPVLLGASFAAAYLKASVVTASSGLATVSWLSAVKAILTTGAVQAGAAAAIAAVTAVTVIADGPAGSGTPTGGGAVAEPPAVHQQGGQVTANPPAGSNPAGSPNAADPRSPAGPAGTTGPEQKKPAKPDNGDTEPENENSQGQQHAQQREGEQGQQGQANAPNGNGKPGKPAAQQPPQARRTPPTPPALPTPTRGR